MYNSFQWNEILIHLILEIYWKCKNRYSYTDLNQRQDFFGLSIKEKILQNQDQSSNQPRHVKYC